MKEIIIKDTELVFDEGATVFDADVEVAIEEDGSMAVNGYYDKEGSFHDDNGAIDINQLKEDYPEVLGE